MELIRCRINKLKNLNLNLRSQLQDLRNELLLIGKIYMFGIFCYFLKYD